MNPTNPALIVDKVDSDLDSAKTVLGLEIEGLRALADQLDESFSRALDIIEATTGRVVVTGMGKSGNVAKKIAATLASTGTSALFVHPAEASHGDLGMIDPEDTVLALSNSGETPELSDIVAYTRRFKIALIAITSKPGSTLAEQADTVLLLPAAKEACPMGLTPTTSTTMMMALGDAIAVALMERKGFTAGEYQLRHPGGQLAQRTMKVLRALDVMHGENEMPLVAGETLMAETLVEMTAKSFGCVGVVDSGGALAGIITDGDLRRHMSDDLLSRKAGDVMTKDPRTIAPGILASEAVQIMNDRKITNLFVAEDGKVVGILHIHDCLRAGVV